MAVKLEGLRRVTGDGPPRLCFYGPPGMGKTTLASEFPDAVFLQAEEGTPGDLEIDSFGVLSNYSELMDRILQLQQEEHDKKTAVFDSLTAIERYVIAETCARGEPGKNNSKETIEDFGYGKGPKVFAPRVWAELLEEIYKLRTLKGMAIIFIGHSKIVRFDDPETVSYDRYEINIHDEARKLLDPDLDAIILLKSPVTILKEEKGFDKKRALAGGRNSNIVMHAVGRPAFVAKNRYGMPETMPYTRGQGYAILDGYFPGGAPAEPQVETEKK